MKQGFIKVAAVTLRMKLADTVFNATEIMRMMDETEDKGAKVVVFPQLCLTGCTCGDLFFQEALLSSAKEQLMQIVAHSEGMQALFFVGLPFSYGQKLYNVAAAIQNGKLLCFIPKTYIPEYEASAENRYFAKGFSKVVMVKFCGMDIPFGTDILLKNSVMDSYTIACEIGDDLHAVFAPSDKHVANGATIIVNPSATDEIVGKSEMTLKLIAAHTYKLKAGYVLAGAGMGESTQDMVFAGYNVIAEAGKILKETKCYENGVIYSDIDVTFLNMSQNRKKLFSDSGETEYMSLYFEQELTDNVLDREFPKSPFVPEDEHERNVRCEEVLTIQSQGLKRRLAHTGAKSAVIGISGGLDSTLALLVTVKAFDLLGLAHNNIICITMPGFGTTDRTYINACKMVETLGATLREISIKDAVTLHLKDIGHDINVHDVTYENAQARERTQILMDIANKENGLVIGTGDMSELALGFATYNGDHMSMYGVNAGVPKTLVRYLVRFYADTCGDEELKKVLLDVLDTPVSPELLPPSEGDISQKTEDIVGPYELHDFFLYYMLRRGYEPKKVYRIAKLTFKEVYDDETIKKWVKMFYRRFFTQQFKRSCLPDGPKIGSVGLSPRGDLRMPSDASYAVWAAQFMDI